MIGLVLALVLGLAAYPLVLAFGPVYFPWSVLVLACSGGVVGLSIMQRGPRSGAARALALALLMVAVVLVVMTLSSNLVLSFGMFSSALVWIGSLLLPILAGVLAGAWLRARMGILRGAGTGAAAVVAIALVGAGLAFALAPPEVAGAPTCADGFECPRTWCGRMAERRRILAVERVTAVDAEGITCTYTAWGGITIGRADVRRGAGGSWTDGAWPMIVSGRGGP